MKLGELATVRSGLVLSRKQARKGAPVKMRYPLLSFRAIHPNGYIDMEQLDGFDAAEQLSPEYLTQIGDVIIRLTSPYTAVLIDEASAGMVVSSNFVIIRVDRSKLLPGYLVWLINTPKIRKAIYENTSSNMLGAINARFFSEFEIPRCPSSSSRKSPNCICWRKRRRRCFASCRQRRSATTIC
ncbi:MAG: restriction endonuclease subunit S [Christensenellales bacterium]